jgi:hypothetical protein
MTAVGGDELKDVPGILEIFLTEYLLWRSNLTRPSE